MENRVVLKIQKKDRLGDVSLPNATRKIGLRILNNKIGNLFQPMDITILEKSINDATVSLLAEEGLSVVDMLDQRAQRSYDQLLRSVCVHLDPDSPVNNRYLLNEVKQGNIALSDVPKMNVIDMDPEAWSKQRSMLEVVAEQVAGGRTNVATTTQIRCPKCNSPVRYEEKQMKSADEAMDIEAECIKCGHVFKR